jgi:hypothetical protein
MISSGMHSERGTALVIALVLLAAVTLMSIAAVGTSTLELRMAYNDEVRREAFQSSESAVAITMQNFGTFRTAMGNDETYCVNGNDSGGTACGDGDQISDATSGLGRTIYDPADTLDLTIDLLASSLTVPSLPPSTAYSLPNTRRDEYVINASLLRASSNAQSAVSQGFTQYYLIEGSTGSGATERIESDDIKFTTSAYSS